MIIRSIAAALVLGPLIVGLTQGVRAPVTASDAKAFVDAHNVWRARVGVLPVRWSPELAIHADRWAQALAKRGCRMVHDQTTEGEGENLLMAGPLRVEGEAPVLNPITPSLIVDMWGRESADYIYAANSCTAGRQCAHYVQIVWQPTEEVGCGGAECADHSQVWVCRYRPGTMAGRRPY